MTFEEWMRKVDFALGRMIGLTSSDIADWHYRDAFDDGQSPTSAARDALENDIGGAL